MSHKRWLSQRWALVFILSELLGRISQLLIQCNYNFFLPQYVTLNTPQNLCSCIHITREEVYILLSDSETAINAQYCVARAGADPTALAGGLSWVCGLGGANCNPIQPGGVCYVANNLTAIASYAYNDYYQRTKATGGTCNFNNTATTTYNNPSNYSDSLIS